MSQYYVTDFGTQRMDRIAEWLNQWGFLIDERFVHIIKNADNGLLSVMYKGRRQIGECEIPTDQQKREALWT